MILNKKPSHIEIKGTGIKTYIRIKNQCQNNFWDGKPNNKRLASHLLTLQNVTNKITHEGITFHKFESDYLREPFFNWNPPSRNTLTAVCIDDVNDEYDSLDEENSQAVNDTDRPAGEIPKVVNNNNYNNIEAIPRTVVEQNNNEGADGVIPWSLDVVSPFHKLLLEQFTNNYDLIAQKQSNYDVGLVIRALILKNTHTESGSM